MATPPVPRSPFTTRLSGSARETEQRIRSIFQWHKKRPPLWALVLAAALILLCGGLVSCRQSTPYLSDVASGRVDQESLRDTLVQAAQESLADTPAQADIPSAEAQLIACIPADEGRKALGAVCLQTDTDYFFVLGVQDQISGQLTGPIFLTGGEGAMPHVTTFSKDGADYLLYTANSVHQWHTYGDAGLIRYDGDDFTWVWPVEGDLRPEDSQARQDYEAYWQTRKALLAPGGVDLFTQTDYAVINGDGPQWAPDSDELFYAAPEDELPIGVMYQTRVWLEEFTHSGYNPLKASNSSALWSIQSLTPDEFVYPGQRDTETAYTLLAQADTNEELYFAAHILFNQDSGVISTVYDCAMGSLEEVSRQVLDSHDRWQADTLQEEAETAILANYLPNLSPGTCNRIYLTRQQPDQPQKGDLRIDVGAYEEKMDFPSHSAMAYPVTLSVYGDRGGGLQWHSGEPFLLILAKDDSGIQVVGEPDVGPGSFSDQESTLQSILCLMTWCDPRVCLYRDGNSIPIGPGVWAEFFSSREATPTIQVLEDWEPIYREGSYWNRWSVEGFTALRYYDADQDAFSLNTLDVTRTDFATPRGIRVGATRAQVLEAYPEALTGNYWDKYPEEPDMLTYLAYSTHTPGEITDLSQLDFYEGLGPAILFFFEEDTLTQITLTNMFN